MSSIARGTSKFVRAAALVEQLAQTFDASRLKKAQADALIADLDELVAILDARRRDRDAKVLADALLTLRHSLASVEKRGRERRSDAAANRRLSRNLRRIALIITAGAALAAPMAAAAAEADPVAPTAAAAADTGPQAILPAVPVGGTIFNPVTNANETVVEVLSPVAVRTNQNNVILLANAVGDVFANPAGGIYTVTAVSLDGDGHVVSLTVTNSAAVVSTINRVSAITTAPSAPPGGSLVLTTGPGDNGYHHDIRRGDGGGGGSDGALFVSADSGGDGQTVSPFTVDMGGAGQHISTTSNGVSGLMGVSIGGDGGDGGDGYLGASGASGGNGGAGGTVSVVSRYETIATSGSQAHGVVAQSRAGIGGEGGSGFVFSSGGSGGSGSSGGTATATNYSTITTQGDGSHGVFAQSLGGGAGSGGGSYGLFGDGGAGNRGGQGGHAEAINYGIVTTLGDASYGVTAQSLGGIGGDAGNAVGLVTFSDDGAPGGNGGTAIVRAMANSQVRTEGDASHALFSQSIGGGGGNGGLGLGLVALGSGGGTGGNGGAAQIFAADDSFVTTTGISSHGVFAQSIGGGGGNGGITGSLIVSLGSTGASGGLGGDVTVSSGATVTTTGAGSRGVFAQSLGGGGGNALGTGGLVSLGGSGGGAGHAGTVSVTTSDDSWISTNGLGSDGIFAQSVGGGGGSGSASGGVVALGGGGGLGGNGGVVTVTNGGTIETAGNFARGIFAQSVGGGGGAGGDSGGLATLGGNGSGQSVGQNVTVTNNGRISTGVGGGPLGNMSSAIQAQSIGGGGGDGGTSGGVFLTIGGAGGGGGNSGVVTINNSHDLSTLGDDSHGIFAQSVGGGGGNGGSTVSISAFAGAAVGGNGGAGGAGGTVNVNLADRTEMVGGGSQTLSPLITTDGLRSRGIFAQSVGGGGGNGGFAAQVSAGYGFNASVAVGGSGGSGGTGGTVNLDGDATILTSGDYSEGLLAQSVGGGGGNGGFAMSFSFAAGETAAAAFGVSVGGSGGNGGVGGTVDVDAGGAIQTTGDFSTGFLTQSVGGGGGNGGFSIAFTGSGAGVASASASVGVGGSGGLGGIGGQVTSHFDGTILTTGNDSRGALIQSVGGGGGNGGFSVSGAVSIAGTAGGAVSVGVGGSGGSGGAGGTVVGSVGDAVETRGDRSTAVTIQSVGGGGGSGGFNVSGSIGGGGTVGLGLAIGIGGAGGGGGAGGDVTGSSGDTILTLGEQSGGLLVQSVGGGGGNGGFNVSGSIGGGGTVGGSVSVGVGGAGGGGGAGGTVIGHAYGAVETRGDQSAGVTIQSIGGGGGSGAFNVAGGIGGGGTVGGAISVGVGGSGGSGGAGGSVTASSVGILTSGEQSAGFLAQSVGGGGGNGGFNVSGSIGGGQTGGLGLSVGVGGSGGGGGLGGSVTATVTGNVVTSGGESDAVTAQSIGGGGGNGGFNVAGSISGGQTGAASLTAGVGGSGGTGGAGGTVGLTFTGAASTTGAGSDAVIAQSVGGGGGSGGFNVSGSMAFAQSGAGTLGIGIGGTGGGGGAGGGVTLNLNTGVLDPGDTLLAAVTTGADARGILAQSVGGGGGNGGFNVTGGISGAQQAAGNIGVGIGGGGGNGGSGGTVIGNINGDVGTDGADSAAVLIQSVGGGGGNGGFNVSGGVTGSQTAAGNLMVGVGGFGGGGGNGGAVSGTFTGDVETLGDRSSGVTYQSLGGGGGNGAFNITGGVAIAGSGGGTGNIGVGVGGFGGGGGSASSVNATVTGDISTSGADAWGALLQSVGGGGGNGGFNITGGLSASAGMNGTLGFGMGGFGGGGGGAGDVTGYLTGDVQTAGDGSYGAMLQSLGGAGGNGGFNVTGGLSLSVNGNPAATVGIGIGGFGGGGGDGANVLGSVTGDYVTRGDNADGVVAQSLGGGGGNGGINVTGNVALSTGTAGTGGVGIGGFGGSGGNSGTVNFAYTGDIDTDGANSDGLIVQSLAGGGGNGAINVTGGLAASTSGTTGGLAFGLGGFGGGGGDAGDVTATVTGNVWARGMGEDYWTPAETNTGDLPGPWDDTYIPAHRVREDGSNGVVVQSIGGGGGNGGLNVSGQISLTAPGGQAARSVTLGVGGFGGAGGDAGAVSLTLGSPDASRVQVSAIGDSRSAVAVQSIGGGGGNGGINVSGGIAMDGVLTAGIGGFGGGGGLGRDVYADVDADLFAAGALSRGMMVQSIGGGGGAGAINVSGGVSADPAGEEPSLTFGMGGFGGAGNASGDVTALQNGQVVVEGGGAIGVLVQSIAGGGGSGGLNVTADVHLGAGGSDNRSRGIAIGVGVGGTGGDGADAGAVSLHSNGNIFLDAEATLIALEGSPDMPAAGILVQSVGGGGGVGGVNATGVVAPSGQPAAIGVGGSGGSGGHGGTVDVVRGYTGSGAAEVGTPHLISTEGNNAAGLIAQSVGGGGGRAGVNAVFALTTHSPGNNPMAALIAVGGSGAGAGSGDDVTVRHNGDIQTTGIDSDGIFAQSLGGGGGDANFNIGFGVLRNATALNLAVGGATGAGGSGADVSVEHHGVITTEGRDSAGIHAQSIGGGGGDTVLDLALGILANHSVGITVGRSGGTGGAAGDVTVIADGTIQTEGETADGVLAQSIGGGGGASSATTVSVSGTSGANTPQAESYSAGVSVGLDGGVGATAGDVNVDVGGHIQTAGYEARGVFAQSIGGGGGRGGSAANTIVRNAGAATVTVGGTGGTGAVSGDVTVTSDATIVTTGHRADGILAQAIGGGGGMGGVARTLAFQVGGPPPTTTMRTLSVNVGGSGGTGAVGGAVDVSNYGVIGTEGEYSHGIRAQSIGGGGGVGGMVLNAALQYRGSDDIDFNIGGSGGTGGAGGRVDVLNEGLIFTEGRFATGISANSIGGGGGDAGLVLDVQLGYAGTDNQTHRFVANIGGSGGDGGVGGAVSVINRPIAGDDHTGEIVTRGEGGYGIFAQSLGGGGGNGSSVLSLTGMVTGRDSFIFGLNIGGSGGTGNTGGTVEVLNAGLIDTTGAGAHGILAQSIGGGGGNGGAAFAANVMIAPTTQMLTHAPLVTVGGFGGDGGDGGNVSVTNTGAIVTRGANAHGILAQSIGGGGGNAQMGFGLTSDVGSMILSHAVSALVGNFGGGSGGSGGHVTVNHSGDITVLGDGSQAIIAQSINGGGGSLTFDFSGIVGLNGSPFIDLHGDTVTPDPMVLARAGAENAVNMSSGDVTINSTGTLQVGGRNGVASLTQAIGGGGGSVVMQATIVPLAPPPAPAPEVLPALASAKPSDGPEVSPLAAGGSDPSAAPGDPVAIPFAIALGGTGGVGNNGGDINSTHTGNLLTAGENSPGIMLQSIGGGGGLGLLDLTIPTGALIGPLSATLGGVNGTNEMGGLVSRINIGDVTTGADLSPAIVLQSIGGGGGSVSVVLTGGGAANAQLDAALGSSGGSGLHGGAVSGEFFGDISTFGDNAIGLLAQSIGGGGGELRLSGVSSVDVVLGGQASAQGDGGSIDIENVGDIITLGDASHGVLLQSIGGGGGAVIGDFTADVTLSSANEGWGGDISFDHSGDIVTLGAGSYGVIAQSLGGGGGWVEGDFAGTAGGVGGSGLIDLDLSGVVFAAGVNSTAIFAQSQASVVSGGISITTDDLVRGGSGSGMGVHMDGSSNNRLHVSGGSVSAVSGLAINATGGNDTVDNDALVIGNIDLGLGDNAFNNRLGSTFVAFNTIDLRDSAGASGTFTNSGDFLMGLSASRMPIDLAAGDVFDNVDSLGDPTTNLMYGSRVINSVALDGDYVQTSSGHLAFDIAFGPYASDIVNVSGNATVDGTGEVILTWLENAEERTLFATPGAGVGVDNGLEIEDTLAMDYSVRADANGVHLSFVSDFGQPFLNYNERQLGRHMDFAILAGDSGGIGRLMALLGNLQAGDEALYAQIFRELNPEPLTVPLATQLVAAQDFSDQLFNCAPPAFRKREQCVWARVEGGEFDRPETFENFGVAAEDTRLRMGFERLFAENWTVAAAVGFDKIQNVDVSDRSRSEGKGFHGSLGIERTDWDGLEYGVSISGGWQEVETMRSVNVFEPLIGTSEPESSYVQTNAHIAYTGVSGNLFVRPALNLSATALRQANYSEEGLDGLGIEALSETEVYAAAKPEVAFGIILADSDEAEATFQISAGGVYRSSDEIRMPYRLQGSNPDAIPAMIGSSLNDEALVLGADLRVATAAGLEFRVTYEEESGDTFDNRTAGLNLRMRF